MAESIEELKQKSVLAHRILVMNRSMGDTTGHVFVRVQERTNFSRAAGTAATSRLGT